MSKVFKLIVDESTEPVILEEDEVLEDILIRLESISNRIDDVQVSLIKKDDEDSSSPFVFINCITILWITDFTEIV